MGVEIMTGPDRTRLRVVKVSASVAMARGRRKAVATSHYNLSLDVCVMSHRAVADRTDSQSQCPS